jgi:hypothetical protein
MTPKDLLTALDPSYTGGEWPSRFPSLSPIPLDFAQLSRLRNRASDSPFDEDILAAVEKWKMSRPPIARREGALLAAKECMYLLIFTPDGC